MAILAGAQVRQGARRRQTPAERRLAAVDVIDKRARPPASPPSKTPPVPPPPTSPTNRTQATGSKTGPVGPAPVTSAYDRTAAIDALERKKNVESRADQKRDEVVAERDAAGQARIDARTRKEAAERRREREDALANMAERDRFLADQEAAREQQARDAAAERARVEHEAAARAGFAGLGLSGAGAGMIRDASLRASDQASEQMRDLRSQQERDLFNWTQQQVAMDEIEALSDQDLDEDGYVSGEKVGGKIGDGDPENNAGKKKGKKEKRSDIVTMGADTISQIASFLGFDNDVVQVVERRDVPDDANRVDPSPIPGWGAVVAGNYDMFVDANGVYLVRR